MAEVLKKHRKSNFSQDEIEVLMKTVSENYETLYGEFSKKAINKFARHRAWLDVTKEVNSVSAEKRTLQEVKNKWKKCQHLYHPDDFMSVRYFSDEVLDVTNVWEPLTELEDEDSMPLEQRLKVPASTTVLTPPPEAQATEQVLQSQPLSPTKLKVTRQVKPSASSPIPPPLSPPIEEVCLRWNSHHSNLQHTFPNLLLREQYVDATLVADGQTLKCHRVILSSCSPYFEDVLASISPYQHPVLFMKDVPFWILKCLCDFMYSGEVHILQTKLEDLLAVAETLKIKGLAVQPDTKMIDRIPEFTIPIKEEKLDEKELRKKEERDFRRKEEREVKKREEKEVKKKEEKEVKKKEDKEYKKKDEKEIKKKEETKSLEIKPLKKKEDKEFVKKDEKQTKKKEEIKEIREKKRVTIITSPERPVIKNAKVPKVVIQTPVPILKNLGVKASRPRSAVESKRRDRKLEKEKIPINTDSPSTSSFANPFGLLKPVYEELAQDPKPSKVAVVRDPKNVNVKRTLQKKLKKRKMTDEREESPPPALSRKGTRSRPRIKVAKYYHPTPVPSYDQSTIVREPHTDQADAFLRIQDIKSEPIYDDSIEIEDNLVGFSESSISVEEHLIDSYDNTFDSFNTRSRHSKPIITVQSLVDQHGLKIVNVAELKENNDPLEDPLGLNQSSSDSASMVEQSDNTLGFRISEVVTAKEDSQSSDVCREMGFKIASIVSGQEEEGKLEASYEEEEFEDEKPIFSLIHPEENGNKMDTNEDVISFKIKEELIVTHGEREINETVKVDEKIELPNQLSTKKISVIQEAHLNEENLPTPEKLVSESKENCQFKSSLNVPQFEDNYMEVNKDDLNIPRPSSSANVPREDKNVTEENSRIMDQEMRENVEDQPMNVEESSSKNPGINTYQETDNNATIESSSNVPQFEDDYMEVNKDDLNIPRPSSSANVPKEDKNVTEEDSEMVENVEEDQKMKEDYNNRQVNEENCNMEESSSNIPDLSNSEKERVQENSSNTPHAESFHRDENQLIEESSSNKPRSNSTSMENPETNIYKGTENIDANESSSNIPDSQTEAFHCDKNQRIDENIEESSSNEHSEGIHCLENQPIDNNFEESSSNIPENISNIPHSEAFNCNENRPIEDNFEENSDSVPIVGESSSNITYSVNEHNKEESSSNEHCLDHRPIDNNFEESSSNIPENVGSLEDEEENKPIEDNFEENSDSVAKVGDGSSNITQPTVLSINENVPADIIEESSSNVLNQHTNNIYEESADIDSSSNEAVLSLTQLKAQSDENYYDYEESDSQHEKQEESFSESLNCQVDSTIPFPRDITREEKISEDSNKNNSFENESSSNVPPENVPLPDDLQDQSMETDIEEISSKEEQGDGTYYETSNSQALQYDKKEESCEDFNNSDVLERCEDESSSNVPPEIVPLPEDQSMETDIDEIRTEQGDGTYYETSNSQALQYDKKEESCLDLQSGSNWNYRQEVNCEDFNNSDVLDESSSNVPPDITENPQTSDYDLHTEDTSSSNEPGFHIARVISEQIAEIEGNRVNSENKVNNSNELESIVNDLSRIVGGSCEESSAGTDDTNSMADCLENLLQK